MHKQHSHRMHKQQPAMKLLLPILLVLLSSGAPLLSTAQYPLDMSGNPLELDTEYYIIESPVCLGSGAVSLLKLDNDAGTCPSHVGVLPLPYYEPVKFKRPDPSDTSPVRLNERNLVSFADPPSCVRKPAWWRMGLSSNERYLSVLVQNTGENDEGPRTWIEVRSTDQAGVYRLAACQCLPCRNICPGVGLYEDSGRRVLGVGGRIPLNVMFLKADIPSIRQYPSKLKY